MDPVRDALANGSVQDIVLMFFFGDGAANRYELALGYNLSDVFKLSPDDLVEDLNSLRDFLRTSFEDYQEAADNATTINEAFEWTLSAIEKVQVLAQRDTQISRVAAGR